MVTHQSQNASYRLVYGVEEPQPPVFVCTTPDDQTIYCQTTVIARGKLPISTQAKSPNEDSLGDNPEVSSDTEESPPG